MPMSRERCGRLRGTITRRPSGAEASSVATRGRGSDQVQDDVHALRGQREIGLFVDHRAFGARGNTPRTFCPCRRFEIEMAPNASASMIAMLRFTDCAAMDEHVSRLKFPRGLRLS